MNEIVQKSLPQSNRKCVNSHSIQLLTNKSYRFFESVIKDDNDNDTLIKGPILVSLQQVSQLDTQHEDINVSQHMQHNASLCFYEWPNLNEPKYEIPILSKDNKTILNYNKIKGLAIIPRFETNENNENLMNTSLLVMGVENYLSIYVTCSLRKFYFLPVLSMSPMEKEVWELFKVKYESSLAQVDADVILEEAAHSLFESIQELLQSNEDSNRGQAYWLSPLEKLSPFSREWFHFYNQNNQKTRSWRVALAFMKRIIQSNYQFNDSISVLCVSSMLYSQSTPFLAVATQSGRIYLVDVVKQRLIRHWQCPDTCIGLKSVPMQKSKGSEYFIAWTRTHGQVFYCTASETPLPIGTQCGALAIVDVSVLESYIVIASMDQSIQGWTFDGILLFQFTMSHSIIQMQSPVPIPTTLGSNHGYAILTSNCQIYFYHKQQCSFSISMQLSNPIRFLYFQQNLMVENENGVRSWTTLEMKLKDEIKEKTEFRIPMESNENENKYLKETSKIHGQLQKALLTERLHSLRAYINLARTKQVSSENQNILLDHWLQGHGTLWKLFMRLHTDQLHPDWILSFHPTQSCSWLQFTPAIHHHATLFKTLVTRIEYHWNGEDEQEASVNAPMLRVVLVDGNQTVQMIWCIALPARELHYKMII